MIMVSATQVLLAGALDLLIGDPRWLPHPVRLIGRAISACEGFLRKFCSTPGAERGAGALLVIAIVVPVYLLAALLVDLLDGLEHPGAAVIGSMFIVFLIATTIAARELIHSVKRVVASIGDGELESARRAVSMIVGRDTKSLDENGVLRAAIETLAENLSDGVVAPLLYLSAGGLPLALAYKAVNTLDSMVGYKNDRYRYFGWAAARLDDLANYVPARITGMLIVVSLYLYTLAQRTGSAAEETKKAFSVMLRDGRNHTSPNSGVPEAAMAGALRIQLGGPSMYGGVVYEKPFIGDRGPDDYLMASRKALVLAFITAVIALMMSAGISDLRGLL